MYFTLGGLLCSILILVRTGCLNTVYGSIQLCLVLQFTYFLFLVRGLKKMVDFLTNRSFQTYNTYSSRLNCQDETLSSLTALKKYSQECKYRRILSREADASIRDRQLLHIKESVPEVHVTERRPFMGLCCQNCTLVSRESLVKKTTQNVALINILDYQTSTSQGGLLSTIFSHLHQVSVLKRYLYPQVAHLVLKDDRVKTAVEKSAVQQFKDSDSNEDEDYQELVQKNFARAKKLTFDMRSTLSDFLLRFTSWILYKLLPCFLTSVAVHPGQVKMLSEASKTNLPLIFLPLHRSHLDYILLSFILLNNNIRSPLVAAGDNLRIPFFGSLLRGLGAFFIKRRIDPVMGRKDYVYKAVLHTYMNLCLRAGHNIEFFLEGGRTRTGKPCMPKYGVLSVIVETFMDGTIEDALLVPVSINYERLIDGNFIKEQLGQPKKLETFGDALKGIWHVLNSNYGMMRVDFNQPFSLRELIDTFNLNTKTSKPNNNRVLRSNPSTNSLYGTDVVSDEHKSLVENISKHVIYDCTQSTSIMSTNALAFIFLSKFRNGASLEMLVAALEELKKDLKSSNRDVGFSGDSVDVINYAVHLLGPGLVKKEKQNNEDIIKPIAILPNVIELSYYSNSVVPYYALESVLALAVTHCISTKQGSIISQNNLMENALELCSIFQYEFLFCKPCQSLEQTIMACIDDLSVNKGIFVTEQESNDFVMRSRKIAAQFDDEEDEVLQKQYQVDLEKLDTVKHLANILMPLLETYSITGKTLDKLVQKELLENELIEEVLEDMKFELGQGNIKYDEAVSVDSIKNALKLYQNWEVLECRQEFRLRLYCLKEAVDNSESVKIFYHKVNKYRTYDSSIKQNSS
ncbi:glycerol-3-phosphate acyltransferase 1, mitochondrial isoform X2 [Euwallacea fornicatus]|uniref:glycerol-3-phosphate acyltransferase 1, mitochondrial isoform X2 n=1 Tax=Euwallacea fornicatus TaxID=995702 RepID=UPI0033900542